MTTTDHGAEASRALNESSLLNEWTAEERLIFATRAQAEATLAVAYEQRTTNLIAAFGQLGDGDDTSYLGDIIKGKALAREIAARLGTEQLAETVTISAPRLPTKAVGSHEQEYLFTAASNLRNGYAIGGSGVRNMVAVVLEDIAIALNEAGK